ncbi:MAG TPA: M28 family peptidase [Nitrolancea sp.]|jgi:Zn-dependent M28 family amino/carboxypeptidase|nr:M28 family peptidase [Nitrolancea sp.]
MGSTEELERRISGDAWTSNRAYENLLRLCDDFGHRFGGSDREHRASEFLQAKMTEYGLQNVHLESFPMYSWSRGSCFMAMTEPVERSFSAISMPYTGSGSYEAEVVDVGEGEAVDFSAIGDRARGKIVLTDAETNRPGESKSHRTDKYQRAVEAGAIACIFVNQNPGMLHISGALYAKNPGGSQVSDHEAAIPGIGISFEAGSAMRRLARRGTPSARIRVENSTFRSHSSNVVGDIPGGELAGETILFGGHYDGHDISQGASDNAAGAAVALETGRLLAPFAGQLKRTVRIVCFGCEEIGLLGSWNNADRYASDHPDGNLRLMVNLDGAGRGQGGQEIVSATADPELANYFANLAASQNLKIETRSSLSVHSDHFPYFMAGFPSVGLSSRDATAGMIGRGYGHTEADTVDKVHPRGLQSGSMVVARLAAAVADDADFSFQRATHDDVVSRLKESKQERFIEHHWGRANRAD